MKQCEIKRASTCLLDAGDAPLLMRRAAPCILLAVPVVWSRGSCHPSWDPMVSTLGTPLVSTMLQRAHSIPGFRYRQATFTSFHIWEGIAEGK